MPEPVFVYRGEAIASYGFGADHPFGADRHGAFHSELALSALSDDIRYAEPMGATRDLLELFHTPDYIDFVAKASQAGNGYLDAGDTPAYRGVFDDASAVAGTTVSAVDAVMQGRARRAFVPIAGLHHAGRDHASGFCVFNDCGIAAEYLRIEYGLKRVAYVDIDAHHGDGVYYGFEDDPLLVFADLHEDGRYLFPGTGRADEIGVGEGRQMKLNIPLAPGSGDDAFFSAWPAVEALLARHRPEFIILQCGADSLAGDPLTHLALTEDAHGRATARLCALADEYCDGRVVATGGGGYDRRNLARAWTRVVEALAA